MLPSLVRPLLPTPRQALWLLPTPEFRSAAFRARGSEGDIASRTIDPPRALANLLERDRLFTETVRSDASRMGLSTLEVSTSLSEDSLLAMVEGHFFGQ